MKDGHFRSEKFAQYGGDLNPGKYKLEIIMPVSQVQAPEVRNVIGMQGEKMTGPLVHRGVLGPSVEYKTTFVNGSGSDSKADSDARVKQKAARDRWVVESCKEMAVLTSPSGSNEKRQADYVTCLHEMQSKKR